MAPSMEKSVKAIANVLGICVINRLLKRRRKRDKKRRVWMKTWVGRRDEQGCYNNLVKELAAEDAGSFKHFARLYPALFDTLVHLVSPLIVKQNTNYPAAISPAKRLAVTLRFLATGM